MRINESKSAIDNGVIVESRAFDLTSFSIFPLAKSRGGNDVATSFAFGEFCRVRSRTGAQETNQISIAYPEQNGMYQSTYEIRNMNTSEIRSQWR